MSLWNGHLCNTTVDVILDSLLLIAMVGAYVPQIVQLRTLPSSHGIPSNYILSHAIFSNAQLSSALFLHAYAWPSVHSPNLTSKSPALEQIARGRLQGLATYGAVLGLLQVFAQWCCSITLFIAYCQSATNGKPNGQRVAIRAFLHAVVAVLPGVAIALPKPSPPSWNTGIPTALIGMANRVVAPVFIFLQFCAQVQEFRRQNREPGSLSILSLGLQALVMALVSIRWFARLGLPHYDRGDVDKMPLAVRLWDTLQILYAWGMLAINYAVCTVGYALLICCYVLGRRSEEVVLVDGERSRLLG